MQQSFVILCLGRSGSTHLQSLLDSHPEIRCYGELFSERAPAGGHAFVHSGHRSSADYLEELFSAGREYAVGFKLPMNSIRAHPEAADLVKNDAAMAVIRLSRRNMLAQLVSRRMQAATKVSHSTHGSYGDARVAIEPRRALNALERMLEDERELDGYAPHNRLFRISYEDLVAGDKLDAVQRFLGVEPRSLRSWFEKLRIRPLSDTVENWDELERALRGTRFEPFLADSP